MIRLKRIYEAAEPDDGERVLVDRLWPRGVSRERAHLAEWNKELAPSTELRVWFHAHPEAWGEFRHRYLAELRERPEALGVLAKRAKDRTVTFLFASSETKRNHAIVLKEALDAMEVPETI